MSTIFTTCDNCGKQILYGHAYVAISRNIEQAEIEESTGEDRIDVIDSEVAIMLCGKCGNAFHYDRIRSLLNKTTPENPPENDILEAALGSLENRIKAENVNFRCVGVCGGIHLLIKKGDDMSDMQPGITVDYYEGISEASIGGKYKHIATPMTFNPFETYLDYQGVLLTDMLLQHLSNEQIREIQAFFEMSKDEMNNLKDVL